MRFQVRVSERAFETMVLAAVEAFVHGDSPRIPKKSGTSAVEVIGPLWGSIFHDSGTTILSVERAAVSLASERTYDGCEMPEASQRLVADVMGILAPDTILLGDFHSHPWKGGLSEARDGFNFTVEDLEVFRDDPLIWKRSGGNPVILVITVCRLERLMARPPEKLRTDLWTFDVGEHRCWITAVVGFDDRQHTKAGDGQVALELDFPSFAQRRLKAS